MISSVAVVLGFVGGFLVANALNRSEVDHLRVELEQLKNEKAEAQVTKEQLTLSDEEIRARIAEADANPGSFDFQKNLGVALYRYATMKQDTALIKDTIRILERAHSLRSSDRDVLFSLGNAYFDLGYFGKDNSAFETARTYYSQILSQNPSDLDAQTELAITYYAQEPPNHRKSAEGFEKALNIDPDHERALQFIIRSKLNLGDGKAAVLHFERLRALNPKNASIPELTRLLTTAAPTK